MTLYKLQKYSFITEQYVIAGRKVLLTDEYRILKRGKSAGFVSFNSTGLTSVIEKAGKKSTLKKNTRLCSFFLFNSNRKSNRKHRRKLCKITDIPVDETSSNCFTPLICTKSLTSYYLD